MKGENERDPRTLRGRRFRADGPGVPGRAGSRPTRRCPTVRASEQMQGQVQHVAGQCQAVGQQRQPGVDVADDHDGIHGISFLECMDWLAPSIQSTKVHGPL